MSNDLAKIQSPAEERQTWELMREQAAMLIKTQFLPSAIKTPEQAVMVMMKGRELGVPSLYALSNIVVIQGKPACSAELLQALIYRDHGDDALRFVEANNDYCTLEYRRRSWKKAERYTFSIDDADRAGLMKNPTWKAYPAAMLRARCLSAVARMAFADSIGGMYTPEELGASVTVVDGVVELDPASVIDVSAHAPVRPQNAPERTEPVEQVSDDDPITDAALEALDALRQRRKLTNEDLGVIAALHFGAEQIEHLTVADGRNLYRYLKNTPDGDLQADLFDARKAIADAPFAEVVEHDNTPTSAEMQALFDAAHPNPMHQ